ncbi:MAG: capsular polysaccharide biosynthesis protein [Eubacterium sp.]|nr:capsular polysaccharide biosynthesis protein [Eubacterium sp.]
MKIIDFHSHILPGIDDGSKNSKESLEMLREAGRQGVNLMVASSHFYANRDRVERFLRRREDSWNRLQARIEKSRRQDRRDNYYRKMPEIRLGAEVAFFEGISKAEEINKLTIEGTNILLLEMPFGKWKSSDLQEVADILEEGNIQIILAHLERFLMISSNKNLIYELMELPLYIQVNAESLLHWRTRGRTLKLLDKKGIGLLGSDCHGIEHRVPNLKEGREVVRKKLGEYFYTRMDELGEELLMPAADKMVVHF